MCDTACVRRPGGMLFAKSSDRPIDEPQVLRWFGPRAPAGPGGAGGAAAGELRTTYVTIPDRGAAGLLGSQPTWMWGLEHGVSEHGVAIGNERVWTVDDPHAAPPALLGMDLVRLGLEQATTADHALEVIVDLLETHGQGGSGEADRDEPYWSSFLVVDGSGGWVLETSATSWVAEPVDAGAAISNRLTLSTGWRRSSADLRPGDDWDRRRAPDAPTGIADHRLAATRRWVGGGPAATAAQAAAVLRDHGTGPWGAVGATAGAVVAPPEDLRDDWSGVTVCMHVRGYQCTTASMIVDLPAATGEPIRAWASLGTPCSSAFLPVAILEDPGRAGAVAVVPAVLGDVDAWRSFAGLSRAVEAPGAEGREALIALRAVLAPVEASAWDQAEELWSSGATLERWQAAAAEWDARLRAALGSALSSVAAGR